MDLATCLRTKPHVNKVLKSVSLNLNSDNVALSSNTKIQFSSVASVLWADGHRIRSS
jgi:hypothetical protein